MLQFLVSTLLRRSFLAAGLLLILGPASLHADPTARERFQQGWEALESGDLAEARAAWLELDDYPLGLWLESRLLAAEDGQDSDAAIQDFLQRHGESVAATDLRRHWLSRLARRGDWALYRQHYRPRGATLTQRCWHLRALLETDATDELAGEVEALWLHPHSLPEACDPALEYWLDSGQARPTLIWQRLALAVEHNQLALARYLTRLLDGDHARQARQLIQVHQHPSRTLALHKAILQGPHGDQILRHGLLQWARQDDRGADQAWAQLTASGVLPPDTAREVRQAIGRQRIARDGIDALPWLLERDPDGEDSYLLEWRIRLALQQQDWQRVSQWIDQLPSALAGEARWRYWQARAWLAAPAFQNRRARALETLASLAAQRHYYGFLAADLLQQGYQLEHRPLASELDPLALEQRPGIARAREWLALDQPRLARREWLSALADMDRQQLNAAALLAQRWQWHEQAIRTALRGDGWNDLELRFPVAHGETFEQLAGELAVAPPWLLAVARQESAFVPDAISPAGARGLLQLMPGTARELSGKLGQNYALHRLSDPEFSIRLGSHYLAELLEEYGHSRILATAAYNAGPRRIQRVLTRQTRPLPADIWIETLPYYETRGYVQSVLSFAVIYQHRLGRPARLVSISEQEIEPGSSTLLARHRESSS